MACLCLSVLVNVRNDQRRIVFEGVEHTVRVVHIDLHINTPIQM